MTEDGASEAVDAAGSASAQGNWWPFKPWPYIAAVAALMLAVLPWWASVVLLSVPACVWFIASGQRASQDTRSSETSTQEATPAASQVDAEFDKLTPGGTAGSRTAGAAKPAAAAAGAQQQLSHLIPAKPQPPPPPTPRAAAAGAAAATPAAATAAKPPAAGAAGAAAAAPRPPATSGAAAASPAPAAAPALTGSAALLAQIRSQRASTAGKPSSAGTAGSAGSAGSRGASAAGAPEAQVTIAYASQTGTAQEIARSILAECTARHIPAQLHSLNELTWGAVGAEKTPVLVLVTSSTGDGDPPDNSGVAWVHMKRNHEAGHLAGVQFTLLGLGDSNYTRFMHVPRTWKHRLLELGATNFYPCVEADEVDGIENTVDPWTDGLWGPLQVALKSVGQLQHLQNAAASAVAKQQRKPEQQDVQQQQQQPQQQQAESGSAEPPGLAAEPTALLLASVTNADGPNAAGSGAPRISLELEPSEGSDVASLVSRPMSAPAPPGAVAAGSAVAEVDTGLVDGIAPADVDLKGVPALAPCRVQLVSSLPEAAVKAAREREGSRPGAKELAYRDPAGVYSPEQPFWATVTDAKLLTAASSDRRVLHMEVDLAGSGMSYGPGDAIGVLPQNDPELVEGLLKRLGQDGDMVFTVEPAGTSAGAGQKGGSLLPHLSCPCTLRAALTHGLDLTAPPRKSLLRLLAEHCGSEEERRTLLFFTARAGRAAYAQEVAAGQPSLLDLLTRFPSCKPPLAELLDALPPLMPRLYSVTSAPVDHPNKLQFAFSVVRYATKHGQRKGVATNWMERLVAPLLSNSASKQPDREQGAASPASPKKGAKGAPAKVPTVAALGAAGEKVAVRLPVFLRPSKDFKPPPSASVPLVMIGPGTGVAPFRGFLEHRRAQLKGTSGASAVADSVLYFGCRRKDEDYLYGQELEAFVSQGVLGQLRVAFSRAQQHKEYVQHLMAQDATTLARLMKSGAYVYVCGDGASMAKDVHAALAAALQTSGMLKAEAEAALTAMAKAGRYVRDVWS